MEKLIVTESNWGVAQNFRGKSNMMIAICERKRKQMNEKFGLLNHKARYISNTFPVNIIRFERNFEICRLIFYFLLDVLPEF